MTALDPRRELMITASNMARALAMSPSYMAELIEERRNPPERGAPTGFTGIKATDWGKKWEPSALAEYELRFDVDAERPGFLVHPEVPYVGGTPDALIGADGGAEVKCPEDEGNHLVTAASRAVPPQYVAQVQTYLWITGRAWRDYVSFDPRCRVEPLVVIRVLPDRELHERMAMRCALFWKAVEAEAVPATLDALAGGVPVFFPGKAR